MKSTTPWQPCKEKIDFIGGFYHLFLLICSVLLALLNKSDFW